MTLVKIINCVLYGADGVTQIPIVGSSIFSVDSGRLDGDELLSLKIFNVLGNGVPAHANSPTDGAVAWIALEGFPIFAVHQVGVDSDL